MCFSHTLILTECGVQPNQPELDEAFGMLRDQAENATVSFVVSLFVF
jgi:hypothetical protein